MTQDEQDTGTAEKLSFSDLIDSLTGFEEVAIEEAFGEPIGKLFSKALSRCGRALIFVVEQRNGTSRAAALKLAQGMRLADVNERFFGEDEDADDADPDDPDTERGKDDSPSD